VQCLHYVNEFRTSEASLSVVFVGGPLQVGVSKTTAYTGWVKKLHHYVWLPISFKRLTQMC